MIKDENINCTVEALVLASPQPVSAKKLSDTISDLTPARVRQAIDDLNNVYLGCGSSFRIREIAGGYQFHILPDFEIPIKKMLSRQRTVRLTRASLETLAIIAYKQPASKTEIEHIRGVSCDGVLHNLMERKLIAMAGRSDAPGRPLLYKTDGGFLKFFGLNRISDLPRMEEIEEMIRQADGPSEQTVLPLAEQAMAPVSDGEVEEAGQADEKDPSSVTILDEVSLEELPVSVATDTADPIEEDAEEYVEYLNEPDEKEVPEAAIADQSAESGPDESGSDESGPCEPEAEEALEEELVAEEFAAVESELDNSESTEITPAAPPAVAAEMTETDATGRPEYFSENESVSESNPAQDQNPDSDLSGE